MTTVLSSRTFAGQLAFRGSPGRGCQAPPRRLQICCHGAPQHHAQQQSTSNGLKMLAVGLAAASLMHSAPADAGVILTKPQLKKLFQDDAPKAVKGKAKEAKEAVQAAAPSFSMPSVGFNPSLLALPAAVGGLGAVGFAVSKLDAGFGEFFSDTIVKDSNRDGFGYETYKTEGIRGGGKVKAVGFPTRGGQKKIKER